MNESFRITTPEEIDSFHEKQREKESPYPYKNESNVDRMFDRQTVDRSLNDYLYILGLSEKDLEGKTVLDVGSGEGRFVKEAIEKGYGVIALDSAYKFNKGIEAINKPLVDSASSVSNFIEKAKKILGKKQKYIPVISSDAETTFLPDGSVDIIINMFSAFYYCNSPEQLKEIIKEQLRVLRINGTIYIVPLVRSMPYDKLVSIKAGSDGYSYAELELSPMTNIKDDIRLGIKKAFQILIEELSKDGEYEISFDLRKKRTDVLNKDSFVLKIKKLASKNILGFV